MVCRYISIAEKVDGSGQLQGSYGTGVSPPVQVLELGLFIVLIMGPPIMAAAKTKEFEIFVETQADSSADNTSLDLTDYVDIADNEALEIHELDIVMDPTEVFPTADSEFIFQLADSNIQDFVSHANRTSLYVSRQTYDIATLSIFEQESFSSLTPLIVSKTLWLRNLASSGTVDFTLRLKGRIVKPSAKDYMALVLTQTGNVA